MWRRDGLVEDSKTVAPKTEMLVSRGTVIAILLRCGGARGFTVGFLLAERLSVFAESL
jgi:hypothetical protein